jgi:exosortase/archaeosortase family protein
VNRENGYAWAALAAPWLLGAWWLHPLWAHRLEMAFGFAVFPLAGHLLHLRLAELAPVPDGPRRGPVAAGGSIGAGVAGLAAGGLLLTPSPGWTAPMWLAVGGAAAITAGLLWRMGGGRLRAGLWPLAFAFTALPWPSRIEGPTVAWLRETNAWWAAELVSALGRPAVARGTTIETAGAWAGVEEACSGIVALQTALMIAVFFGELRRLRFRARLVLVAGALGLGLLLNLARATWLVWLAAENRAGDLHTVAGQLELGLALALVGAWSALYGRGAEPAPAVAGGGPRVPLGWVAGVVAGVALAGGAVAGWYRLPERDGGRDRWWSIAAEAPWQPVTMPEYALEMLAADRVVQRTKRDPENGRTWVMLHVRWRFDPSARYGAILHGPELCLPMAGAQLEADLGTVEVKVGDVVLPLAWKRFRADGQPFHTFNFWWDPTESRVVDTGALAAIEMMGDRLARVLERRRQFGLERITVAFNRCREDAEAARLIAELLPQVLRAGEE